MILAGQYDRAFLAAERARKIFTRLNETRRLARLDNNVGNIYHRQDRFEKALAHYERSFEQLLPFGDSEELTIALNNMAVCLISLNEFRRAVATYERMKAYCDEHRLPLLVRRPTTTSPIFTSTAGNTAGPLKCCGQHVTSAR